MSSINVVTPDPPGALLCRGVRRQNHPGYHSRHAYPIGYIRRPATCHIRAARPDRRARHRPRNALRDGKAEPFRRRARRTSRGAHRLRPARRPLRLRHRQRAARPRRRLWRRARRSADPPGNRAAITAAVRALLDADAIPVVLGGDDSVPIPMFRAFEGRGPLTVVQIDAHLDWRDEVHGEKYGWSSPMRRASEMPWIRRMVQVGLRGIGSARAEEVADARAWGSRLVPAADVHRYGIAPVLDMVDADANCLLTLDCDGIDPSVLPAWSRARRAVSSTGRCSSCSLVSPRSAASWDSISSNSCRRGTPREFPR